MPYVNVKVTQGPEVTREAKAALVAGITALLVDILGKEPQHTHVVIDEIALDNWGFSGQLTSDFRQGSRPE